jgi:hypothetical protein
LRSDGEYCFDVNPDLVQPSTAIRSANWHSTSSLVIS